MGEYIIEHRSATSRDNMAANYQYGGHSYDFVNKDLEKYTCTICTKVLRDPHLTGCCGQVFCETCLNYWFTTEHDEKSCPHCRAEGEEFTHILDKRLKREIDSLKIYCTNKEEGCQWVGEVGSLKDHLESDNGCDYVVVECPNKCEETTSTNVRKMKRKEIANHLQNECDLRPYQCEHCGYKDTYEAITGGTGTYYSRIECHYDECPEFPLKCPNKCDKKDIKRKDMEDHLSQCPEEKVECPNKCKQSRALATQLTRKDLAWHLSQECNLRPYQCEHCGLEDNYESVTRHHNTCPEFPLECANKCGTKDIKRKDMEDHRSQCSEEWVECPYKCEPPNYVETFEVSNVYQNCQVSVYKMKRKEFENHIRNECDLRPYQCEHCGHRSTYRGITGGDGVYSILDYHYDECPEFPLECPHSCGVKDIKRKDMEDHRGRCPEEEVKCPNRCESSKSDLQGGQATRGKYKRKDLAKHLEKECVLRPYQCEHCGLKDTYFCIVSHYTTCPEFPIKCPNSCSVKDIKRKDMEDHRSQCPEEPVQCPFAEVGCDRHLLRRKLKQHTSTTQQQHLLMVMGAYKEVKKDNEKMEKAYEEVKHELQQVKEDNLQMKTELQQIKKRLVEKKIIRSK